MEKTIFVLFSLILSSTAFADDRVGFCYSDARCTKPLADRAITSSECARTARMDNYKLRKIYWITDSPGQGKRSYRPGYCELIYDRVPWPKYDQPIPTSLPYGSYCGSGIPCEAPYTCQGLVMTNRYCR